MLVHTHRLFIALLASRFGVVSLLPGEVFARVHDNMDSGLVFFVLGARFWARGMDHAVLDLPMNGVLDWTHFASLTWPLQMIYALAELGLAYALTELVVVTGYCAMLLLLQDIARNDPETRATPVEAAGIAALMA